MVAIKMTSVLVLKINYFTSLFQSFCNPFGRDKYYKKSKTKFIHQHKCSKQDRKNTGNLAITLFQI